MFFAEILQRRLGQDQGHSSASAPLLEKLGVMGKLTDTIYTRHDDQLQSRQIARELATAIDASRARFEKNEKNESEKWT